MRHINLVYLSNNTTGGWVTFTSHLFRSLQSEGVDCTLWKHGNRTESKSRPFGYGLQYRNLHLEDLLALRKPVIIVAVNKHQADVANALIKKGARVVLHDPTELGAFEKLKKPWVIRKINRNKVEGAVFIRHPYVRHEAVILPKRKTDIISTSRIDFDKYTHILLDANRLGAKIKIYGFENRLYTRFNIVPKYPEWEQSKCAYPREHDAAFNMLLKARAMVDMSLIKGDGGGTQYTTLEAWDAGAVPIINTAWLKSKDDMVEGLNCETAFDGASLKKAIRQLTDKKYCEKIMYGGWASLSVHRPKLIVPKILKWLET